MIRGNWLDSEKIDSLPCWQGRVAEAKPRLGWVEKTKFKMKIVKELIYFGHQRHDPFTSSLTGNTEEDFMFRNSSFVFFNLWDVAK